MKPDVYAQSPQLLDCRSSFFVILLLASLFEPDKPVHRAVTKIGRLDCGTHTLRATVAMVSPPKTKKAR
jgi:hypothetical protein